MAKKLDLLRLISRSDSQLAALCVAMIVSGILSPGSKLSTARMINANTCASSLGEELDLEQLDEEALYRAMDFLVEQQERIEKALAGRHLREGCLVLYDVSSTWLSSPDYPGERLIVCRNPLLAERRTRKREDLLQATEKEMEKIKQATLRERAPLHSVKDISLRVGRVAQRFKMKKHFILTIEPGRFDYQRNQRSIQQEAALDGFYVVRTSLPSSAMAPETVVATYKRLSTAERAFRSIKTVDLKIRPIFHRRDKRVRAHVFLCMLAYYVEWHMRKALAPILFDDDVPEQGEQRRGNIVKPAQRSLRAEQKARSKRTEDGTPVHSFQSLLRDLATIAKNRIQPLDSSQSFDMCTRPTPVQQRALDLLTTPGSRVIAPDPRNFGLAHAGGCDRRSDHRSGAVPRARKRNDTAHPRMFTAPERSASPPDAIDV